MIVRSHQKILLATNNPGKMLEIREALSLLPIELRYLSEFPNIAPVDEVGQTYEQNAVLKAFGYSKVTRVSALADDSGLEVDALGGMPGVLSARFGGPEFSDPERVKKLLTAMSECNSEQRTARFVCCMALAGWELNHKTIDRAEPRLLMVTEGRCEGVIAPDARGSNGFGFDPVFIPFGYNDTFAELPNEIKATISHRARALAAMRAFLDRYFAQT